MSETPTADANDLEPFLATALEAAAAATRIVREAERQPLQIRTKSSPRDLVTQVDTACEAAIRAVIARAYPEHRVLGEEGGEEGGEAGSSSLYRWVVDPLDGTSNFARGVPHFAVSIGLEHGGQGLVGVVANPLTGDVYQAVRGAGCFKNEQPVAVSGGQNLKVAYASMSFSADEAVLQRAAPLWDAVLERAQTLRRMGSTALELALLAEGKMDVFIGLGQGPWDTAAGRVLVTEAGGSVRFSEGGETCIAAASEALLEEVASFL